MFTMVASSTTISWARAMKTRAIQRRGTAGPETGAVIDMRRCLQGSGNQCLGERCVGQDCHRSEIGGPGGAQA